MELAQACGINTVQTLHMDRYWSATPQARRKEYDWMKANSADHDANDDNMWCNNPEETIAFMETVQKPWVAFKVMAAGAIPPRMAFSYAYRHGADFVIAGMFDFQVESDVKIAIENVRKSQSRKRPGAAEAGQGMTWLLRRGPQRHNPKQGPCPCRGRRSSLGFSEAGQ